MSRRTQRSATTKATLLRAVGSALALAAAGCALQVEGGFDDVEFRPEATAIAILDKHDFLVRSGGLVAFEKPRANRTVSLWLSGADVETDIHWRTLPSGELLELRRLIATEDALLLTGIDYDSLRNSRTLQAVVNTHNPAGSPTPSGDFDFALGHGRVPDADVLEEGLGGLITVTITESRLEEYEPRGGHLQATVSVRRDRAFGQPSASLAVGEVILRLSLPFAPERLAKSNLTVQAPIARCQLARGPDTGSACWQAPPDPDLDETGPLR
jgi:hypothetical protein